MRLLLLLLLTLGGCLEADSQPNARPVGRYQVLLDGQSAVKIDTITGDVWFFEPSQFQWIPTDSMTLDDMDALRWRIRTKQETKR